MTVNVRAWPLAGVGYAVLWIFVRGVELAPRPLAGQFLFGLAVGLPTAFVFRRLYVKRIDLGRGARVLPYAGLYVAAFTWELVRANVDVAHRVLAPGPPIDPEVVLVPLRVRTDLAVTLLANSITITPGTVTLDHDEAVNALYVHAIDGRDPEAIVAPIRRWESYALELFDEPASSDDPPRPIVVSDEPPDRAGPGDEDGASTDADRSAGNAPDHEDRDGREGRRGDDDE